MKGRGDRGSVSILALGLLVVCLMALGVIVDLATLELEHRRALSTADATARAAAQALDLRAYYLGESASTFPLDSAAAHTRARRYLSQAGQGWHLERLTIATGSVAVGVSRESRLPFTWMFGEDTVTVVATGQAQLRELRDP